MAGKLFIFREELFELMAIFGKNYDRAGNQSFVW